MATSRIGWKKQKNFPELVARLASHFKNQPSDPTKIRDHRRECETIAKEVLGFEPATMVEDANPTYTFYKTFRSEIIESQARKLAMEDGQELDGDDEATKAVLSKYMEDAEKLQEEQFPAPKRAKRGSNATDVVNQYLV